MSLGSSPVNQKQWTTPLPLSVTVRPTTRLIASPLMAALYEQGPVAVSAAANGWGSYESGIFTSESKTVDHAVTLIGYGEIENSDIKYWLIQNSWTGQWGEGGRIRLKRHDTDSTNCGVDTQPELGTGCKGGPKQVTVCGDCGVLYDSVVPHFYDVE